MRVEAQRALEPAQTFFALAAAQENLAESAVQNRIGGSLGDLLGDNLVETHQVLLHLLELFLPPPRFLFLAALLKTANQSEMRAMIRRLRTQRLA